MYVDMGSVSMWFMWINNTAKPVHVATSMKQSPFSSPVIENFMWIEPLLRGYLSFKASFSLSQWWPLNTGLTVCLKCIESLYFEEKY
jgi:hypothetical protein